MSGTQLSLVEDLKSKTQDVEELSMKIDELLQINMSLENLTTKVQRYNAGLFNETQQQVSASQISESDLRKLIS
mgnify:CR=1 FL=1|jgi:hypothetical protein